MKHGLRDHIQSKSLRFSRWANARSRWGQGLIQLAIVLVLVVVCAISLKIMDSGVAYAEDASPADLHADMVVEWLKIKVAPENRDLYVEIDNKIWTPALAQYPGFLDKTTWLNPADDSEVVFVICWATREQWKAISVEDLEAITQAFDTAFPFDYEMAEEKEYLPQEF